MPPRLDVSSDLAASAARAAHDVGVAALIGGNLFARVAMHPSLREIGDESERGKVLNRSWQRYGRVNGAALAAIVGGWTGAPCASCWTRTSTTCSSPTANRSSGTAGRRSRSSSPSRPEPRPAG